MLFAVILGHSFLLASEIMIPIHAIFDPANHVIVSTLAFSYTLIISGWIGYSRSTSVKPHKDTSLGALRFILDLIILFEYFYLLQISQTEHIGDFPLVVLIIFGTYVLSDIIKHHEHSPRERPWIRHRTGITVIFFVFIFIATTVY